MQEEDNHYMCLYVPHIFSLSCHAFEWSRGGVGGWGESKAIIFGGTWYCFLLNESK